ncbi:MAG: peptide chain release factor N(5)-glutamine methyltransferase [Bacteroidales bacterium]|nr:peptide chain release factor N(5)-glutamine methyltransferase [Bacteroidales bacterium]
MITAKLFIFYFRSMNNGKNSVDGMIFLFHQELSSLYPEQEIRAILYQLFDDLMGWSRAKVHLNRGLLLNTESGTRFLEALGRLKTGEPIQYITGHVEFCGLTLTVQPGVLIPRPETEELAVMVTRDNQSLRNQSVSILDIGTGSGCLALALKKAFPFARVKATDRFKDALDTASKNALANQLEVDFYQDDILNPSSSLGEGDFQIIVSNPPYIPENEKADISRHILDYEPENALFVPASNPLLFYHAISRFAKAQLAPGGMLYVEVHERYGEEAARLFRARGFHPVELSRDLFGKQRFIRGSLPG